MLSIGFPERILTSSLCNISFCFSLQDAHDLFLEQERDRVLTRKILILQKAIRGWYYRRRFLRMRKSAVVIQRCWRGYIQKQHYNYVSQSYYKKLRTFITLVCKNIPINNWFIFDNRF